MVFLKTRKDNRICFFKMLRFQQKRFCQFSSRKDKKKGICIYAIKAMQNLKKKKKKWGIVVFFCPFIQKLLNSHCNVASTAPLSTWQHGIPGNKTKPIFPFPDLMQCLEVICMISSSRTKAESFYGRTHSTNLAGVTANSAKYANNFLPYTVLLGILIYTHTYLPS